MGLIWPTELDAGQHAPVLMKLLGDPSEISLQAMYMTRACGRLKGRGVQTDSIQVPVPEAGITIPVLLLQNGNTFAGYTWYGAWTDGRADAFLRWKERLRSAPSARDLRIVVLHDHDPAPLVRRLAPTDHVYLQQVTLDD